MTNFVDVLFFVVCVIEIFLLIFGLISIVLFVKNKKKTIKVQRFKNDKIESFDDVEKKIGTKLIIDMQNIQKSRYNNISSSRDSLWISNTEKMIDARKNYYKKVVKK